MPIYDFTYNPEGVDNPGAAALVEIARWNDGGFNTTGQAVFQVGPSKDFVITAPSVAAANAPAWITADGGQGAQTGTYRLAIFANGTTTTPLASLTGAVEKPWDGSGHATAIGTLRLDDPNTAANGFDSPYTDIANAFDAYGVANAGSANATATGRVWKLFMSVAGTGNGRWTVKAQDGSIPATTGTVGYNQTAEAASTDEDNHRLEFEGFTLLQEADIGVPNTENSVYFDASDKGALAEVAPAYTQVAAHNVGEHTVSGSAAWRDSDTFAELTRWDAGTGGPGVFNRGRYYAGTVVNGIRNGYFRFWLDNAVFPIINPEGSVWRLTQLGNLAPPTVTLLFQQGVWDAGTNSSTSGIANYISTGAIQVNNNGLNGVFPSNTAGNFRLRRVDNSASIFGTLTVESTTTNTTRFRIGTAAEMITAFGSANITSGQGWILETVTVSTPVDKSITGVMTVVGGTQGQGHHEEGASGQTHNDGGGGDGDGDGDDGGFGDDDRGFGDRAISGLIDDDTDGFADLGALFGRSDAADAAASIGGNINLRIIDGRVQQCGSSRDAREFGLPPCPPQTPDAPPPPPPPPATGFSFVIGGLGQMAAVFGTSDIATGGAWVLERRTAQADRAIRFNATAASGEVPFLDTRTHRLQLVNSTIVGKNLKRVTGRLSYPRFSFGGLVDNFATWRSTTSTTPAANEAVLLNTGFVKFGTPLSGASPTASTQIWRLSSVVNGEFYNLAGQITIEGDTFRVGTIEQMRFVFGTGSIAHNFTLARQTVSLRAAYNVGSYAQQRAAFGPGEDITTGGGQWVLSRETTAALPAQAPRTATNAILVGNTFPIVDNRIYKVTLIDSTSSFNNNSVVGVPTLVPRYVEVATWNSAGNILATNGVYDNGTGLEGIFRFVGSTTPKTGSIPSDTSGLWRLSKSGLGSIFGEMTISLFGGGGHFIQIGSSSSIRQAFGLVPQNTGADWVLERLQPQLYNGFRIGTEAEMRTAFGTTDLVDGKFRIETRPAANITGTAPDVFTLVADWTNKPYPGGGTITEYGNYAGVGVFCFSRNNQLSGAAPTSAPPAGTYKLSWKAATGSSFTIPDAATTGVTGTIQAFAPGQGATNQTCFRVGTAAQMQAAFGTTNSHNIGTFRWVLERQTASSATVITGATGSKGTMRFTKKNVLIPRRNKFVWNTDATPSKFQFQRNVATWNVGPINDRGNAGWVDGIDPAVTVAYGPATTLATFNAAPNNSAAGNAIYLGVSTNARLSVNNAAASGSVAAIEEAQVLGGRQFRIINSTVSPAFSDQELSVEQVILAGVNIKLGTTAQMRANFGSTNITTGTVWSIQERRITTFAQPQSVPPNCIGYFGTRSGVFPADTSGTNWRLTLINNSGISNGNSVTGALTVVNVIDPAYSSGFRVGTLAQMRAAFGSGVDITSGGGQWILEQDL